VHTWNLAGSSGGTGILLHTGGGRVQDAYLDYAPLVILVSRVEVEVEAEAEGAGVVMRVELWS
jgi:hypothetical protein